MRWKWTAVFYVSLVANAVGQQPSPVSRAEVRLEAAEGQTHFRLGDLIFLELVFRDPAFPDIRADLPPNKVWLPVAGQLSVNGTDYGDIADDVAITPSRGWFQWQGKSRHDYSMQTPLDAKGVRVPVVLNQGYIFREPGHYEVAVTTRRMGGEPATTNVLNIDIVSRSAEEEAGLVGSLDFLIANTTGEQQKKASRQLAYLPGDEAVRAKVKWLLSSDQGIAAIMAGGLAATKNQTLQLELIRKAWSDPSHAPDGTLQLALQRAETFAHGQSEPGWTMMMVARKDDAPTRQMQAAYHADLDRVIATLPQRTGDVRRDTAYYLMQDNELSAEQLVRVKPVVLEEFPRMEPIAQSMLIETRWNAVKDASLAPALKAMIKSEAQDTDAASAVQRLVEIDEGGAKPYVVEMVCRSGRGLQLNKLNGVKQDRLPEVNACLSAMLSKGERREHDFDWEQGAQRAARFATVDILPAVKAAWTNPSQDSSMLALFARDAPKEALALLNREPDIDWFPTNEVYEALGGKLPPEVLAWLRQPKAPKSAEYELSLFGDSHDRTVLESRLSALRAEWRGHGTDMQDAQPNTPAYLAKGEEQELVSSLLEAKAWTLTAEEKQQITDGCVSDWCQRYAPPANVTQPH